MVTDIRQLLQQEIAQLRDAVAREEALLAALKADLKTREAIERLLAGGAASKRPAKPAPAKGADAKQKTAAKPAPARPAKRKPVAKAKPAKQKPFDWESVLGELPNTFTTDAAAEASGLRGASRRPLAMAVARWIKLGKIKRVQPGTYRKIIGSAMTFA